MATDIDWPAPIAFDASYDDWVKKAENNKIQFKTQAGPPKRRPMGSAVSMIETFAILVPGSQAEDVWTFYVDTTKSGSLPFNLDHPRSGSAYVWQFETEPTETPIGADSIFTFDLRRLP